mgnify:CR=1 FL=1
MEYKKHQLNSILFLLARGFTYQDVLILPIHERNNIINLILESNMADKNISISLISNLDIPQHVYNARAIISSTTNDMRFDYAENILPPYPTITNETLAQRDSAIAIAKDIFVNTFYDLLIKQIKITRTVYY